MASSTPPSRKNPKHDPTDLGLERLPVPVGPQLVEVMSIAHRARLPVLLEGGSGIGKSEITRCVAQHLGLSFIEVDLALLEPPDLVGIPYTVDGVTRYAPPAFLPRDGAGLIILEELNRCERHIQQPALQFLTSRRLHDYELPEGWSICAAINPENGEYQVNPLDPALRRRFLQLQVRADRDAWLSWAREEGLHPSVVRLAETHDQILNEVPPRTWTYTSRLLQSMSREELANPTLLRVALPGYLPRPWLELLLQEGVHPDHTEAFDLRALLRNYHHCGRLQKRVTDLTRKGRTDRIEQLYRQLHAVVDGAEFGHWITHGGVEIAAFEDLLQDLPGDFREGLQEAFALNPVSEQLLSVRPEQLLRGYRRSLAQSQVRTWLEDPALDHRIRALVKGVTRLLESHADLPGLRRSRRVLTGLGHFVADLGPERAQEIEHTLQRLRIKRRLPN